MKHATVLFAIAALAACNRAPAPGAPAPPETDATIAAPATASLPASPATVAAAASDATRATTRLLPQAFRGDESLASLQARFGADNVSVQEVPGAEGDVTRGIVLFPNDPMRRAMLYFADGDNLKQLTMVRIVDDESTWTIGDGLRMGTTLAELVAKNGAPIEFSGFGWDYGGAVASYRGGALEPRGTEFPRTGFRLAPREGTGEGVKLPLGEATFASDDPAYAGLAADIVVGELTIAFPRQAQ